MTAIPAGTSFANVKIEDMLRMAAPIIS